MSPEEPIEPTEWEKIKDTRRNPDEVPAPPAPDERILGLQDRHC